jgi:hypothetical protein
VAPQQPQQPQQHIGADGVYRPLVAVGFDRRGYGRDVVAGRLGLLGRQIPP